MSLGPKTNQADIKNDDAISWIKEHFRVPETPDKRLLLHPYQENALRQALSLDEAGNYNHSVILWSDIKKSIKSTLAGAVVLWRAFQVEWGQFLIIANDLKQADSRVFYYIRRAIELNPYLREQVKITNYRIELPNKTYIEAIPIDPSGEAGSNADAIVFSELWGAHQKAQQRMWCLDDQTEALTKSGWKKGVELTADDSIAVYDNGFVKWEKPKSVFCEEYSGEMHDYTHRHFSLVCTPDHRLYGDYSYQGERNKKYSQHGVMKSNELRASGFGYYHPKETIGAFEEQPVPEYIYLPATKFKSEKRITWDDWCAFLGLYLTEGCTTRFRGVPCRVRISQLEKPHPDKYWAIHEILVRCFGEWVNVEKYDGFSISSTSLAALTAPLGTTWTKRVPREIINGPRSGLEKFMKSFILGDGGIRPSGSVQIGIASKLLADDVQEIAFRLGIKVSLRPSGKYWRVHLPAYQRVESGVFASVHKKHWKTAEYKGKVWCPSVSTGLFVARRGGYIFVTGNSEMTLSPTKFGKSFRWIETYAGFTGESPLLEQLYQTGVKNGRRVEWASQFDPPLEAFENDAARMFTLWNGTPRLSWQSNEYYCMPLPSDPERFLVMTNLGPKPAAEISKNDLIATRTPEGNVKFENPKAIHKFNYTGDLYSYSNSKAEFSVTKGHRLLARVKKHTRKPYSDNYELIPVEEAITHQMGIMPTTGGTDAKGIKEFDIEGEIYNGDDFLELMAWYISEGSIQSRKHGDKVYPGGVWIAQDRKVNSEKHKKIGELLTRLGLREQSKDKHWGWIIYNSRLARYFKQFGRSSDKYIPEIVKINASQSQLRKFINAYALGDGTPQCGGYLLYTNSDQLKEDLSLVAWKAGYRVADHGSWSQYGNLPIHHIYLSETDLGWSTTHKSRNAWSVSKSENLPVWCPETSYGTFYAIVDGSGFWTGNSSEEAVLLPSEFKRMHRNEWSSSEQSFVQFEWLKQCEQPAPALTKNQNVIIAMDAAISGDCFGLLMLSARGDDELDVRYARKWIPPKGGKLDFRKGNAQEGEADDGPEAELRRLLEEYNVVEVCYDPYQLEDLAMRMSAELLAVFYAFNQGGERAVADKSLYDRIRSRRLHYYNMPDLEEHILNANVKTEGEKMRLIKKSEHMKIDLAVCLSMAADRATYWGI